MKLQFILSLFLVKEKKETELVTAGPTLYCSFEKFLKSRTSFSGYFE